MRKLGLVILIVLALVAAVGATGMITLYLKKQAQLAEAGPALLPVVVSATDLSFGKTLEEKDLHVVMFPEASVPKGAVSRVDSLIGQTTKVFLAENEPVLVSKLSSIGGGLSLSIAPTMRAASVQVDKVSGVSGFILPGDRVDVIAIVKSTGSGEETTARTILQSIEVLAAGEKTEQQGKGALAVQSVTLLVEPSGAEALALAANEGKIHLSLRNPNDVEIAESEKGLTKSDLLGEKKPAPQPTQPAAKSKPTVVAKDVTPAPTPRRPDSLTIIRGADAKKQRPAMETPATKPDTTTKPG